jgi:sporulation protein YlmC with PRC-barrel domain
MNYPPANDTHKPAGFEAFQLLYFSKLLHRRIRRDQTNGKNGRLTDLVFRLSEPYPEAVGIYIEHSQGRPSEFVPWGKVTRIEDQAIFITPSETGNPYPPFDDQKGWILLNEHLMGQTILDTDGRRTEVVNDVHLLFSQGRMILVHVDISFNGFLRKWGMERFAKAKDQLISWRYVQPLSVEDHTTDVVTLSVARGQALELPSEDLADALD